MKIMSFEKLGLIRPLLDTLKQLDYQHPTPIQNRVIGPAFAKKDVFATAQTGTGKTAAFLLPMIQRLRHKQDTKKSSPRALILAPTRELAIQIEQEAIRYAQNLQLSFILLAGGKSLQYQQKKLKELPDIIVATPGRLREHTTNDTIDFTKIEIFVVDEADRMLDMGFVTDIRHIHEKLPKRHQTLLFSATYNDKVRKLSRLILKKPVFIETAKQNSATELVEQMIYLVDKEQKARALSYLIGSQNLQQVLVFTKTKKSADALIEELTLDGLKTGIIHGDKTQASRGKTLQKFKDKEIQVLVATDIASRGIDIEQLPQVINYELPTLKEDYIHRIGRTGRAGHDGKAITLLDNEEKEQMKAIERLLHVKIPREQLKGFELDVTKPTTRETTTKPMHKKNNKKRLHR
jgi:ATP-dependent RNA helicase RhlE